MLLRLQGSAPALAGAEVYFSTHPPFPDRLGQIQKYLDSLTPPANKEMP